MPPKDEVDRSHGFYKKNLETMPPWKRTKYLNEKLKTIIRYAHKNSHAFRNKMDCAGTIPGDIEAIQDLGKLPVTLKSRLIELQRENPPFGGFEGVPLAKLRRIFVSPGPIHEPGEADYKDLGWAQALYAAGFRSGDIAVNTFSYHMVPFALNMLDNALFQIGCITIPAGVGNTEQQVHILRTLKVTAFCGTPSFLLNLADKAEEMGLDLKKDLFLRVGFVAAEMLPESLRSQLEENFGMMIRQSYGTADIGCLGYECFEKNGFHVPDDKIVEIVEPRTGKTLGTGKAGEVVGTTFNKIYPLIRFGTGDLSLLTQEPCPCGRTSPRLVKILGRVDQATKVRGLFVHPGQVKELIGRYPQIEKYRLVVTRKDQKDEMTLQLELKQELASLESFNSLVEKSIRDVLKVRGTLEIVPPGTIPEGCKIIEDLRIWG
jgi:phenylacetate-CoA ligase